eukprot:g2800.t1
MLGVAEGGCFPGVVYYLSLFYPDEDITQPLALIIASVVFALPISAVIAAGLLKLDGLFGIAGWRYLFIVEGVIPVLFSFLLFWKLPESVDSASFLSGDEKKWIREHRMQNQSTEMSVFGEIKQVLRNRAFLWICLATAMFSAVQDMLMYWLTLLIHGMLNGDTDSDAKKTCGSSDKDSTVAIVLTAVPFVFGGILCISLRNFTLFLQNRTLTVGAAKGIAGLFLISWLVTKQVSFALGFMSLILSIGSALFAHSLIHGVVVTLFSHSLRAVATGVFSTSISLGTLTGPLIMGKLIHEYGYSCGILSNQKLLADLRRQLNVTEGDNVVSLEKVLSDPEVKSSKGRSEATSHMRKRLPPTDSDNETDTERDEDYHREEDDGEEDSCSEGSTTRPNKNSGGHFNAEFGNRESTKNKSKKNRKKMQQSSTGRRGSKTKSVAGQSESVQNRGATHSTGRNPLSHDDVQHYEVTHGGYASPAALSSVKPPYEKSVFENYLLNGNIEELKEMNRQIKKKRQALINTMLDEEDDNGDYFDDDLVQKILLRERNARQERVLESELKSMTNSKTEFV